MSSLLFVSYSGVLGGAERVLLDVATSSPHATVIACPAGPLLREAAGRELTVLRLPERDLRLRGGVTRSAAALAALAGHASELRRLVRDVDADLTIAWGMRSAIAALALPAAVPLAVAHHDFLPGRAIGTLVRHAAKRARVVTVPSAAVGDELDPDGRLGDRLRVVAPGVDPERFAAIEAPSGAPHAIVLGALAGWKRPDLALEIAARARHALPGLTLTLAGAPVTADQALVDRLRQRAVEPDLAGVVELPGSLADPRPELARAWCLLHCAPAEPFGIVVLESLAAGRPVVVPDAGGPREIVDDSCAERYPPGDAQAGADALVRLLADPERLRAMGAAGRTRVRDRFSLAASRRGFEAAFGAALETRPAGATVDPGTRPAVDDLTLVTVTYNSAPELKRLIRTRDRHLPGVPIVVVDNASSDGSAETVTRSAGVRVVTLDQNVGFGGACNRGLREVRTGVAVLVNPDVELVDGSLGDLARAVRDAPDERILAPLVLNVDGTRQQTAHPRPSSLPDLVQAVVPSALLPSAWLTPWRATRPRRVGWAVGAALAARTEVLSRLGPFDESIFMYGEDLELGLRAAAAGIATWFWPAARVVHAGAHTTAGAYGGEPFTELAEGRRDVVAGRLGRRRARRDRRAQIVTFATRIAYRRALGRPAEREQRQLAAARAARVR
jgi:GT2 family glycosyltransferase/glycosyltransferase involved in cell wall biosynthesis